MELKGIHQALREGCRLQAFCSGGGLRIVRIEKDGKLKGYGEHPMIHDALSHVDEDFLAGGKPHNEVYGKKYPHYLTGSASSSNDLDVWILRGCTFDVWQEGDEIIFQLNGYNESLTDITKTGKGKNFWEAMSKAFEGDEIVVETGKAVQN